MSANFSTPNFVNELRSFNNVELSTITADQSFRCGVLYESL